MVKVCAQLRVDCVKVGHALSDKLHDGDRWIAAAAVRLGCPLVSHARLFVGVAGPSARHGPGDLTDGARRLKRTHFDLLTLPQTLPNALPDSITCGGVLSGAGCSHEQRRAPFGEQAGEMLQQSLPPGWAQSTLERGAYPGVRPPGDEAVRANREPLRDIPMCLRRGLSAVAELSGKPASRRRSTSSPGSGGTISSVWLLPLC